MPEKPLNAERPAHFPLRPSTPWDLHVIARLVYADREEWRPAMTCRWTATHVLVQWWHDDGREGYTWLPADDVRRGIVVPRADV